VRPHAVLAVLATLSLLPVPSWAGQVRVDVSNIQFTPAAVTVNHGDHVVWVWLNGTHSATSGSGCVGDGIFDSGLALAAPGVSFSWKSGAQADVPYFCMQHCDLGMTGAIHFGTNVAVADFRITEVQYNVAAGKDLVEITNHGNAIGNLGDYRLSAQAGVAVTLPLATLTVPGGGRVVLHANASGTNTATDVFLPALPDLPVAGAVALYVPNSQAPSLAQTDQVIDFVQWGAAGGANEATASGAALWSAGQFVPGVADGHSLELCDFAHRGAAAWAEVSSPNFGSNGGCATPAIPATWGSIKLRYR
jgi:plastocyanin